MKHLIKEHPRAIKIIVSSIIAAVIGVAMPFQLQPDDGINVTAKVNSDGSVESQPVSGPLQKGTPKYDTVLPAGKKIEDYGGWTRVSPPNREPVYAYADRIGTTPINVSQQPLPKEFAEQPDQQVQQFAAGYAANRKLKVGNATAFIGTSAKGPQSVIVVKGKLLILIKASAAVSDDEWEKYIQSLS